MIYDFMWDFFLYSNFGKVGVIINVYFNWNLEVNYIIFVWKLRNIIIDWGLYLGWVCKLYKMCSL